MAVSKFYTLFWIIYFPTCIAFYSTIQFYYIDEILTLLLICYTFIHVRTEGNRWKLNEVKAYSAIMVFYVVYSLIMAVNVSTAVWLDLQQQVRPYAVFYCTWLLAPQFSGRQKNMILGAMGVTIILYILSIYFNLTHESMGTTIIGQLSLIMSMSIYCFKPKSRKSVMIAILVLTLGLLSEKSKFYGEYVVFIALVLFLREKVNFAKPKTMLQFVVLVSAVLFFSWAKFNSYYIEGFERSETEIEARPVTYLVGLKILGDYFPLGSGLGTFACNAAAEFYSPLYYKYELSGHWGLSPDNPMFLADCFYPVLAQYGIVGIVLFAIFWRRRIKETKYIVDERYYKMALMCILALAIESVADTSYLSGKGMGFFMLLAICLNKTADVRKSRVGNLNMQSK